MNVPALRLRLIAGHGSEIRAIVDLSGEPCVIGRTTDVDWYLPDPDAIISGRHCRIAAGGGGWEITDTSTNGTRLNGADLPSDSPTPLNVGDVVGIGDYRIAVEAAPASGLNAAGLGDLLASAGIDRKQISASDAYALAAAGDALVRVVTGLLQLLDARMRTRSVLAAQATILQVDANNPLKFARDPRAAVAMLLDEPSAGFMASAEAIDDAFRDLQSHQSATLRALRGALAATLAHYSPTAMGAAAAPSPLERLVPVVRQARMWRRFEKAFGGVVAGSHEAAMDIFSREYARLYAEYSAASSDALAEH